MTALDSLTPEQRAVVDTWGQGMAVLAGAGSGKTTTLVVKCTELLKVKPGARFAAVSFTEKSANDLRAKLAKRMPLHGEGGALSGHWVMTIHGLCGAVLREFPRESGFDGEESMLSEPQSNALWERAIESLWSDDLPPEVQKSFELLLSRESSENAFAILKRIRELFSFGVLDFLGRSEDPISRALQGVATYVLDRYDRIKKRRGALDFNDLERGADLALNHPAIRELFQRRFDLVLIDEFQDTNPLQAKIIWRFVKPDASNLCVVGDPKQSIYRFRDADVSVFEEFCTRLPVKKSLTWNFRSRPGIIEFANAVCGKAFPASEMSYEALIPKRESVKGREEVIRLEVQNPSELGQWIRSQVLAGLPLHEMTLLLRKIRGNEKWLKALTVARIPLAVGSGGLFWEDPRVRELVFFLKWWANPGNSLAGAVFMRAPWMGIADTVLDKWVKEDATFYRPFFNSDHPVAQALLPFKKSVVRPGELLMALLVSDEIEIELGSAILGLWHRVEEASLRGTDFQTEISELSDALEQGRRERDVPPPRNQGQLSVLTLHGSKGLEFPHVILVDFGPKSRAQDSPLLFWDRERGAFLAKRDEDGDRDREDPDEMAWRELEKKKTLAESKRLFYVALTRAQERLILVCPDLPEKTKPVDPVEVFHQEYWRGWLDHSGYEIKSERVLETAADLRNPPPSLPRVTEFEIIRTPYRKTSKAEWMRARHSVTEWNLLSRCPRAYEWTYVRPVPIPDSQSQLDLFKSSQMGISQKDLGSRVHRCLELRDFEGLKGLEAEVGNERFVAQPLIDWASKSERMLPAEPDRQRDVWTELAFEIPIGKEILVGSLDRLVRNGDQFTIVDFKITSKPKARRELLDAYRMQMSLYAWALSFLEPKATPRNLEVILVNISSLVIQETKVATDSFRPDEIAQLAVSIVEGEKGEARPGSLCKFCQFRELCPEGTQFQNGASPKVDFVCG